MAELNMKLSPRKTFWKCGACSHAMFHLLNHEFSNSAEDAEKASDLLAGGIAQKGHQCGMLWGASLACGTEAYRNSKTVGSATSSAIIASGELMKSFTARTKSPNCRDIAKVNWDNKLEFILYMLKIVARGFVYSPCFNLIAKWTPEAVSAAKAVFAKPTNDISHCLSCASETVKKMGGTDQEAVMVAGFAGGIGLSGHACGALAAAIWYKMLQKNKQNKNAKTDYMNNPDAKKILRSFYMQTDSEVLCKNICGQTFKTATEHTDYIKNGGCKNLIDALATI